MAILDVLFILGVNSSGTRESQEHQIDVLKVAKCLNRLLNCSLSLVKPLLLGRDLRSQENVTAADTLLRLVFLDLTRNHPLIHVESTRVEMTVAGV